MIKEYKKFKSFHIDFLYFVKLAFKVLDKVQEMIIEVLMKINFYMGVKSNFTAKIGRASCRERV